MKFLTGLFGKASNALPYFTERSDEEAEHLLRERIRGSRMGALHLGNSIVRGMHMPWDQARRVVDKLKAEGVVDYEIPHDTWVRVASH